MLQDKQCPIIIGHKYQIEILPNVILTGTYEYVREITVGENKIIQLVKFNSMSNRFRTNVSQKYDFELIAMAYAFKETFNVDYFQTVSIDIESQITMINTYTDKEYDLLKRTTKSVVLSIQNDIKCLSPDRYILY